jgi:tRNA(Arg) A34 adenosine deaminase TadA
MMRYSHMEKGYQYAFAAAIRAYRRGSTPIGCAIMDEHDELLALGENSIYAQDGKEVINFHQMAHAEINAILKIKERGYSKVLYTTMEPCAMCFGAVVMNSYKKVKFAARDPFGGGACLNSATPYIIDQGIAVTGPVKALQMMQYALLVFRNLEENFAQVNAVFEKYKSYCAKSAMYGRILYEDTAFKEMIAGAAAEQKVIEYVLKQCT